MPDCLREAAPSGCLSKESPMAFGGKSIKPGLSIVFRCAVFSGDQAVLDKPLKGRIERTVAHLQHFARTAFNGLRNGMPMCRTQRHRLQNQQIESSLKEPRLVFRASSRHSTPRLVPLRSNVKGRAMFAMVVRSRPVNERMIAKPLMEPENGIPDISLAGVKDNPAHIRYACVWL